ncbi:MAG: hypothetical protein N5P05_000187 [Chroococcopsis gigantea SAG 12.99]|jgi:putative endonuclease|nr:YraN family protein [Chlorogloea purpurea SAG 13.99]MDV2998581.1 hypothetical protein [Chroococcopsis gigantea SAG 12.99]
MTTVGELGEILVIDWLAEAGWKIISRRWRTRYGEIDIIALGQSPPLLAFIEVKSRSENNWDEGGKLAVDYRKQEKLSRTAAMFLSRNPQWAEYPCRFDVALVAVETCDRSSVSDSPDCLIRDGYRLRLSQYLENAFDYR